MKKKKSVTTYAPFKAAKKKVVKKKPSRFKSSVDAANASYDSKETLSPVKNEQGSDPQKPTRTATTAALGTANLSNLKLGHKPPADTSPHLIIQALAGTGKTTTLIEGLKRIKGIPSTFTPSPQQAEIWLQMENSKGKVETICFVAFNRGIATELQQRVPPGCEAMTMHSMGLKAITAAFGRVKVDSYRLSNIISEVMEVDIRELRAKRFETLKALERLVALCKMNLADTDDAALEALCAHYDIEYGASKSEIFSLTPRILERCKAVSRDSSIDFDDMVWLPVALDLKCTKYDVLLCDELQDFNRTQQQLALKAGHRIIGCGDKNQAIYGFAGADSESMDRMMHELSTTDRGCVHLPLTVTRRCSRAVVQEARKIVPEFEAHESNCEGLIRQAAYKPVDGKPGSSYFSIVQDGDMVLCRVNAPLVSQCFKFLRAGRKATIMGRDVGQGLISTINKMKAESIVDLTSKLSDWFHNEVSKERAKRLPSDSRIIALQDRYDCLKCFCEDQQTVQAVIDKINAIFTDNRDNPGVRFASIHRSKGLEAKAVYLLEPKGSEVPHPMAKSSWQIAQEWHLRYVAITRAIETLTFVS